MLLRNEDLDGWSRWPHGLRGRSAAACLLELWVRNPLEHKCLSLMNSVCCQVKVRATGRSLVQRSPTECLWYCVISKLPKRSDLSPSGAIALQLKNENFDVLLIG